ncbi:hypothetical protein E2C01_094055 [Portunus trituberculatus]|uniref:Uncharacterized protein n=1 Tax=Portunus trituberculatus TaxID=210409 RepID=A0A5B7JWL5_PORTR|nr:hypothetical protein [Portunus trituberculatus]
MRPHDCHVLPTLPSPPLHHCPAITTISPAPSHHPVITSLTLPSPPLHHLPAITLPCHHTTLPLHPPAVTTRPPPERRTMIFSVALYHCVNEHRGT